MTRTTTNPLRIGLLRLALALLASSPGGCSSSPPGTDEPTLPEVRKQLTQHLATSDHLTLTELQALGERRYEGLATAVSGTNYRVTVTTEGRRLTYQAESQNLLPTREPQILRGTLPLPEPSFEERYPRMMQWLRGTACILHTAGVVWPVLGRFGLRRTYSPRTEKFLRVFAALNLGFALMWGYQFATGMENA